MRVLYVERTGLVGGGERSLLGLLGALPAPVTGRLASPPGPLSQEARRAGVTTVTIAESVGSLKLHPVHTPVALGAMSLATAQLVRAVRTFGPDLVHANSIRAGLIAAPAAALLGRPLVLHVRDALPPSPLTRSLQGALAARAAAVIAISRHVADAFDPDGRTRELRVIDNPFHLGRLDPDALDRKAARARLRLPGDAPVLTLVGQITPWKGQQEAIEAVPLVRERHPGAVLLIVGETKFTARATRYDNRAYLQGLHETVTRLGLDDAVRFLGEREDVPEILRATDLALAPSWDEPFGRTVVEAMAMGLPMLATDVGGPAEVIHHGVDGVLLPPRRPELWAAEVVRLLADEPARRAIGAAARRAALARFGTERHAAAVVALYREVLGAR